MEYINEQINKTPKNPITFLLFIILIFSFLYVGISYLANSNLISMKPMKKHFINYIYHNGIDKYYEKGKYIVVYANIVDLVCPQQDEFLQAIEKSKNNPDYKNKYIFIEFKHHQDEKIKHEYLEEYLEEAEYRDGCNLFCIIDLEHQRYFDGSSDHSFKSAEYVYDALSKF